MLKKSLMLIAMVAVTFGFASPSFAGQPLKLDAGKSKIDFVGKKTDGQHGGGFKKFTVDADADFEDPSKSSLKITIESDSIWSDDDNLTAHLKNADFFNVRKFPEIKFESTSIQPVDEGKATIKGKLTMLGKTEEIEVPCTVVPSEEKVELNAKFKIDRTLWGMDYGVGKINKEVEIEVDFLFKL